MLIVSTSYYSRIVESKPASVLMASLNFAVGKSFGTFTVAVLSFILVVHCSTPGRAVKAFSTLPVQVVPQTIPGTENLTVIISAVSPAASSVFAATSSPASSA